MFQQHKIHRKIIFAKENSGYSIFHERCKRCKWCAWLGARPAVAGSTPGPTLDSTTNYSVAPALCVVRKVAFRIVIFRSAPCQLGKLLNIIGSACYFCHRNISYVITIGCLVSAYAIQRSRGNDMRSGRACLKCRHSKISSHLKVIKLLTLLVGIYRIGPSVKSNNLHRHSQPRNNPHLVN